ncbi:MAG: ABC transporter ATP-binding protein [Desulfatirhabdiaceae bacterium]
MGESVISVKNLGKRYILGTGGGERYRALRDVISNTVKNLFKRNNQNEYPQELWALKGISFDIRAGEKVGIIGRNGAGKSTLLKILSEITEPTEGQAYIHGRVASLLEVGTGFHPELTGKENIFMNGAILGMRHAEIKKKFDEIAAFAEIEQFLETPVKRYSSGMYVRLAFAVAAHLEPEILLIDEVLAVGDAEFQKKCLGKMDDISKGGRTILFVSHNLQSISNLCSRAILMNKGKIEIDGVTTDVVRDYIFSVGKEAKGEARWDIPEFAPGDEKVRLHSIQVLSPDGIITDSLSIDQEIVIKISYWNLKENNTYCLNINLKDQDGSWVLTTLNVPSANIEVDPWFNRPQPIGLFESSCRIPGNFLNNHTYSLYLAIVQYGRGYAMPSVRVEDVISFTVYDNGSMTKEYNSVWHGPVRPILFWRTDFKEIIK